MKLQIEELFKEKLGDFQPDVPDHIWQGIQSQLPAQPVPAPDPASIQTVVKTGVSVSGKLAAWVVGAVITASVATVVVINNNKETITPRIDHSVVIGQQEAPSVSRVSNGDVSIPERKASTVDEIGRSDEKNLTSGEQEQLENKDAAIFADHHPVQPVQNTPVEETAHSSQQPSDPAANTLQKGSSNQIHGNDPGTGISNPSENNVPLVMILNNETGFAPLTIAALPNRDGLQADWDFGDGTRTLKSGSVTHRYDEPGIYEINMQSDDEKVTRTIEVLGKLTTAFSPNGDGINDNFQVEGGHLRAMEVEIMDRNGRMIYKIHRPGDVWNGNLTDGRPAEAGTYYLQIIAETHEGKKMQQRSAVRLFR